MVCTKVRRHGELRDYVPHQEKTAMRGMTDIYDALERKRLEQGWLHDILAAAAGGEELSSPAAKSGVPKINPRRPAAEPIHSARHMSCDRNTREANYPNEHDRHLYNCFCRIFQKHRPSHHAVSVLDHVLDPPSVEIFT